MSDKKIGPLSRSVTGTKFVQIGCLPRSLLLQGSAMFTFYCNSNSIALHLVNHVLPSRVLRLKPFPQQDPAVFYYVSQA